MESKELNLNKESVAGVGNSKGGGDGFIDRSKVRILLCDNDANSSEEVLLLLLKCSYQVTAVRSARQVIDALNAEGSDIDIILAEVDLPMTKGMKMLKYIMRDKELRRIPVIMMSAQDEVSIVVKCLRLGAADYLVKPLRTNELLNLWTHMWRRRRMLGLAEKNILNCEFDLVASDPSDANTNSTTVFSDDTDDRSRRSTNPETGMSTHQETESISAAATITNCSNPAAAAAFVPPQSDAVGFQPDVPGISDRHMGQFSCGPKKSELKIGESSAFFTYVKSSMPKNNSPGSMSVDNNSAQNVRAEENCQPCSQQVIISTQIHENGEAWENCSQGDEFPSSSSVPDSLSLERSSTPPVSMDFPHKKHSMDEKFAQAHAPPRNDPQHELSGLSPQTTYPFYVPGAMNQVMMPSSAHLFQKNLHDLQNHATPAMLSHYNHLPQCLPHVNGMASFPYYPVGMCIQPGQMSTNSWPTFGSSSSSEVKLNKVDRREAALMKFRQKRKERCFDKKIRYVNRKQLAERRPRVRGQFVRKINGVNRDLNGQPTLGDYDDDEDDEEEQALRDSFPEDDTSGY
ncbi:two-component response regulator-like APRR1 [Mangifera indica]|uniref:two-component response regulator-like APRR1 n=1 Tax=Mangifera indica TaxID=29780 RepID=UPI001CF9D8BA|nr:two-component response regulator-like APRR1 [Mangifera indica]XP_044477171.1 two-component response regulator-like APRR1 [Mangifera indica]XP_044477172.1 two-component response regulator-like APRR1 [Mangifera indica]XP_044477174.1 two-component response regulator-like APRR1 [Mangifera indica]